MTIRTFILGFAAVLPLLQSLPDFSARAVLKPRTTGLFSIPERTDARATYERLAERAGINVVFHPSFVSAPTVERRIENLDAFDALDSLSAQTGHFWFPYDSRTVIIGIDTPGVRIDTPSTVLKTIYLPDLPATRMNEIVDTLRMRVKPDSIAPSQMANAIMVAGAPERVAAAEQTVAALVGSIVALPASVPVRFAPSTKNFVATAEQGTVRNFVGPMRSFLEGRLKGELSIDQTATPRAIYEALAQMASLNIVFDRGVEEGTASRFRVNNVGLVDAMDLLALQTSTTWQPLNDSTLWVAIDNATNRRQGERMTLKVIYLPDTIARSEFLNIVNVLRTTLLARTVFQIERNNGIVIKDTDRMVFLAEKLIADLVQERIRRPAVEIQAPTSSLLTESGWKPGMSGAAKAVLEPSTRNRMTVRLNTKARDAFQSLAGQADLKVVFDEGVAGDVMASLTLYGVDIFDALDLLAWQTGNFWQVLDRQTIRVLPDTPTRRREFDPILEKTIRPVEPSDDGVKNIVNVLRTTLGLRDVSINDTNAIVIRDTADNIAMAEQLVSAIER